MLVTKWALVRGGVPISLGRFAVVELSIHEIEKGGALFGKGDEPFLNGLAHCV
jgi:hypothetical protein